MIRDLVLSFSQQTWKLICINTINKNTNCNNNRLLIIMIMMKGRTFLKLYDAVRVGEFVNFLLYCIL